MKTIILLLLSLSSFAQLKKIDTNEPISKNIVIKDNQLLASAEIYNESVEIVFFESTLNADLFFDLTITQFIEIGKILQSYDVKDKDFYSIKIAKGMLYIRFVGQNGYVQSEIYMDVGNSLWYFPKMNRVQYKRLFSI